MSAKRVEDRESSKMAKIPSVNTDSIKARPRLWNLFRSGQLRIRVRLTACFAAIIFSMLAASLVAVWQFRRMTDSGQRLNRADQTSLAVLAVHLDVDTLRNRLAALADAHDGPEFAKEAASLRRKFLDDVTHAQQLFSESNDIEDDPLILSTLQTVQVTLPAQVDSVMGLAAVNDWPAVRRHLNDQVQGLLDLSSLLVERVEREVSQQRAEAIESAQRARRQLLLVLPATVLFTMLMAVGLGWHVTRTITEPLSQLYAGAQALGHGELQHEVKVTGEDELATLGNAFNYAARSLRELYEALTRSEAYLAESQRLTQTGSWAYKAGGAPPYWSEETFRIWGFDPQQGTPDRETVLQRIHPEDRDRVCERGENAVLAKTDWYDEFRIELPDGTVKHIHAIGHLVFGASGEVIETVGTNVDITERKRAEQERLRVLEERQAILERHQAEIGALNERLMKAQEEERMRIAGELHDGVLQQLTSLALQLGTATLELPADSEPKAEVREVENKLIQVGTEIRQLSHELHPVALQEVGLRAALSSYCEEFSKTRGIPISYKADQGVEELSPGAALCIYRIAQEALGNVAKHARAKQVEVRLSRSDSRVCFLVSDDGVGFHRDGSEKSGGLGLINMRERVRQLGGTFEFESEPGRGTTVKAEVPFRPAS